MKEKEVLHIVDAVDYIEALLIILKGSCQAKEELNHVLVLELVLKLVRDIAENLSDLHYEIILKPGLNDRKYEQM